MKKLIGFLILLLCCAHLQAQQFWLSGPFSRPPLINYAGAGDVQSAPIKCDKYQHVEHHPSYSSGPDCQPEAGQMVVSCPAISIYHEGGPDTCEENVLMITARDWQKLMKRLKALEDKQPK